MKIKTPNVKKSLSSLKGTRIAATTPKFFRVIRNIGLVAAAVGVAIATAPVSLPAVIVSAGGYLAWIAGTAATISQFAKE